MYFLHVTVTHVDAHLRNMHHHQQGSRGLQCHYLAVVHLVADQLCPAPEHDAVHTPWSLCGLWYYWPQYSSSEAWDVYGFSGVVISWLHSYLSDRFQSVKLDHCLSRKVTLPFGVPHRSVLGPLLFCLYTGPLSRVMPSQSVPHDLYADDTQLYISFSADNSESSFYRLQQCLVSIQDWMTTNKLKLNPNKTEFLLMGHERQRFNYLSMFPVSLLGSETHPFKTVRNLGIVFDENFNFRTHINNVCKLSYYHIRDLHRIRKHLNLDQAKCLASALVSSRLDYCNSLLHGVAASDMLKLQRVQNCPCQGGHQGWSLCT